jgi:predicted O-methyltransferase YrrM
MEGRLQSRRESDLVAEWVTRCEDVGSVRYPAFYMQFMREWHARASWDVRWIKGAEARVTCETGHRFQTLLHELATQMPIPPLCIARTTAKAADRLLDGRNALSLDRWAGDTGLHFEISSSLARKGRLLCAAVRFLRPTRVLELGTAYGMSSLFMGLKLERLSTPWSITTVDGSEAMHALALPMLRDTFKERVTCVLGSSQQVLKSLNTAGSRFDLLFHDAEHSCDAYVSDFNAAEPLLTSGAVCLIDDLRWDEGRFHAGAAKAYEGWQHIVAHPRVLKAAELDRSIGIMLLS